MAVRQRRNNQARRCLRALPLPLPLPLLLLLPLLLPHNAARAVAEKFDPYIVNGGLVSAVAGRNFAIIASDTRMIGEGGYVLQSRSHLSNRLWSVGEGGNGDDERDLVAGIEESLRGSSGDGSRYHRAARVIELEDTTVAEAPVWIGSSGCSTDCSQLRKVVRADVRAASHFGQVSFSSPESIANLLGQTLYGRRGFPYYAFCVASGLGDTETDPCGRAYVYDAIGSYERVAVAAAGTGRELLQPVLDRAFGASSSSSSPDPRRVVDGTLSEAIEALCSAYRSVSEREIGVGDALVLHVSERRPSGAVRRRVFVVPLKEH